jgi:hypothetical protein
MTTSMSYSRQPIAQHRDRRAYGDLRQRRQEQVAAGGVPDQAGQL